MSRRSASSPASSGEATAPIDEDEQDKIADELKLQALAQSTSFRNIFHYIFLVVVLILFICLLYSIFSPWEIDHQQVFKDLLPIYGFFSYYCASMFCFLVAAMIVKENVRVNSIILNAAYFISVLSMLAWGAVFFRYNVTNPLLYWLPCSNLAGIALAHYVDRDSKDLITSAEGLEQYKYRFKGV